MTLAAAGIVGRWMEMNVSWTESLIGKDYLGGGRCLWVGLVAGMSFLEEGRSSLVPLGLGLTLVANNCWKLVEYRTLLEPECIEFGIQLETALAHIAA